MWAELKSLLAEHPAKWMIWEAPPLDETKQALADRGIGCVVVDPCGNVPESGNYLTTMRANIARLEATDIRR